MMSLPNPSLARPGIAHVDVLSGGVFGELGLLAPNQRRTQTLECIKDAEVMKISYDRVKSLHFANPSFGFIPFALDLIRVRPYFKISQSSKWRLRTATRRFCI